MMTVRTRRRGLSADARQQKAERSRDYLGHTGRLFPEQGCEQTFLSFALIVKYSLSCGSSKLDRRLRVLQVPAHRITTGREGRCIDHNAQSSKFRAVSPLSTVLALQVQHFDLVRMSQIAAGSFSIIIMSPHGSV